MIGGGLIQFHRNKKIGQSRDGFGWKCIKARAPAFLSDVLTETAMEGLKGLNAGAPGGRHNWKGGLAGIRRGAMTALIRKAKQQIKKLVAKRVERDIFGL